MEVEQAMNAVGLAAVPAKKYKARLRRVALSIPSTKVHKALKSMRKRAKAVVDAKGGYVKFD